MRRKRRAKIVATLGPATSSATAINALFEAGVDVFRFNFSHGEPENHARRHRIVRELERDALRPIGVMADMQGPKLRVGVFEGGSVELEPGRRFILDRSDRPGTSVRVSVPHPEIFAAVRPGDEMLLDDGRLRLNVTSKSNAEVETQVLVGGRLSDRKGINLPGVMLPISPLTEKDLVDLRFALELGCEWIALSFVQRPEDVVEARRLIGNRAHVLVKVEKPSALDRIDEIVAAADAVMVARGDLGVEMPPEEVPIAQKTIIRTCRDAGKPVIVATQMLESMVQAPVPTRAEVSDIATAVYDGADAVMLSAETAVGAYPTAAVQIMDRVIKRVERDPLHRHIAAADHRRPLATSADAISVAAHQVADTIGAAAIVTYTTSGSTTLRAARERPDSGRQPILGVTSKLATARRLSLTYGVHSVLLLVWVRAPRPVQKYKRTQDPRAGTFRNHTADVRDFDEMVRKAVAAAALEEVAAEGRAIRWSSLPGCLLAHLTPPMCFASSASSPCNLFCWSGCVLRVLSGYRRTFNTNELKTHAPGRFGIIARCLRCLLLVMCTHPFAREALTLHLAHSEGHERYFGCNLMHRKVLAHHLTNT